LSPNAPIAPSPYADFSPFAPHSPQPLSHPGSAEFALVSSIKSALGPAPPPASARPGDTVLDIPALEASSHEDDTSVGTARADGAPSARRNQSRGGGADLLFSGPVFGRGGPAGRYGAALRPGGGLGGYGGYGGGALGLSGAGAVGDLDPSSPLARWADVDRSLTDDLLSVAAPLAYVAAQAAVLVFAAHALHAGPRQGEYCRTAPLATLLQAVAAHALACAAAALAFVALSRLRPRALQTTDLSAPANRGWRMLALALAGAQALLVLVLEAKLGGLGLGGAAPYLRCGVTAPGMFITARWLGAAQSWVFLYAFLRLAGGDDAPPQPFAGAALPALAPGSADAALSAAAAASAGAADGKPGSPLRPGDLHHLGRDGSGPGAGAGHRGGHDGGGGSGGGGGGGGGLGGGDGFDPLGHR